MQFYFDKNTLLPKYKVGLPITGHSKRGAGHYQFSYFKGIFFLLHMIPKFGILDFIQVYLKQK